MMKLLRALVALTLVSGVSLPNAYPFAISMPTQGSAEAAIEILNKGGNATDAMVAGAFALNVTQPYNMGLGGGGFYLAHAGGKTYFWNSREMAPASASEKMFLDKDGKPINYYPERVTGPNPVGVPGTVAGLWAAHRKLGKLPWKMLLAPAIRLAHDGFPITSHFADILEEEWPRISKFPTTAAIFGDGEGGHLRVGRMLRQPLLAKTLETIANGGGEAFYHGELATSWLAEAARFGVKIDQADLDHYRVATPLPIEFKMFGLRALISAPPSAGGIMVAGSLRFLEHYYRLHDVPAADSATRVIVTTETLRYFQNLRNDTIADPPAGTLDPQTYLGSTEEKKAWVVIEKNITDHRDRIETRVTTQPRPTVRVLAANGAALHDTSSEGAHSHTAHMSILDDAGMSVAYTSTIEQWFGSGIAVAKHGFLLNNELSDFTAEAGKPNSPAAGKRPRSNMSPMLLFEGTKPVGVLGCAGGGRIPTVLVELLENYYIHKMTLREAMAFPRFHPNEGKLELDPSYPTSLPAKLHDAGYDVASEKVGATPHALMRRTAADAWEVAAEPRADGMALTVDRAKRGK